MADLPTIAIEHPGPLAAGETFLPYLRNERLARPWALPGTPGLMHRIGGLEKQDVTGGVSYDAENHQRMIQLRAAKVAKIADDIPPQDVAGPPQGDLLVLSWGGTYGACATAVAQCQTEGLSVAHAHLRYLSPFPRNLGALLRNYRRVLIPELNLGQLRLMIRATYLVDAVGFNKVKGKPFTVEELVETIRHEVQTP
jgi:2-oxoglutarate ferredoxin oxidoreductase subunit alpha